MREERFEYVWTKRGRLMHRRNPDNRFVTLCHRRVWGPATWEQVDRCPWQTCDDCARAARRRNVDAVIESESGDEHSGGAR